ncbi:MAG: ArnT family glycosyltransferase [Candidatus Binatia bacterium]
MTVCSNTTSVTCKDASKALLPGTRPGGRAAVWLCVGSVTVSVALRILYLGQPWRVDLSVPPAFLAAEGIVGLMARHILAGARPVFYYGQYYMGALEAYLAAGLFRAFGPSVTTLRLAPTLFAVAWIPLTAGIAGRLYGRRAGFLAAALVALPSQFVFEWGFRAWGHVPHVTMLLLTLYLLVRVLQQKSRALVAALGFVTGFSLWVNQLALGYVAVYVYALWAWVALRRKEVALLLVAGLLGLLPLLYGNVTHPLSTARNLASKARASWRLSATRAGGAEVGQGRVTHAMPLLQVLGAQSRADGTWSVAGSLASLFLVLGTVGSARRACSLRGRDAVGFRCALLVLASAGLTLAVGVEGFFGQPVGRYQLVLYPLLCVLAAGWLDQIVPRAAPLVVGLIALGQAVQLLSPIPAAGRTAPAAVVAALERHGLSRGYGADYMYDLIFLSGERVIIDPLGYSRYRPYQSAVAQANHIFYLYRSDQVRKVTHRVFMTYLADAGIRYRRFDVGQYHVLFDFEPPGRLSAQAIAGIRQQIRRRKEKTAP